MTKSKKIKERNILKERFEEKFVQFDKYGVPVGGHESPPYTRIWKFIEQALKEERNKVVEEMMGHLVRIPENLKLKGFEDKPPSGKTWIAWFLKNDFNSLKDK